MNSIERHIYSKSLQQQYGLETQDSTAICNAFPDRVSDEAAKGISSAEAQR